MRARTMTTGMVMAVGAVLGARPLAAKARPDSIDEGSLRTAVNEAARLRAELREAHLRAHLATRLVLTPEQVARYDALRGYARRAAEAPE